MNFICCKGLDQAGNERYKELRSNFSDRTEEMCEESFQKNEPDFESFDEAVAYAGAQTEIKRQNSMDGSRLLQEVNFSSQNPDTSQVS